MHTIRKLYSRSFLRNQCVLQITDDLKYRKDHNLIERLDSLKNTIDTLEADLRDIKIRAIDANNKIDELKHSENVYFVILLAVIVLCMLSVEDSRNTIMHHIDNVRCIVRKSKQE